MQLQKSALENLRFFKQTISSIKDGSCDQVPTASSLQDRCSNIRMEAEIAMAVDPEANLQSLIVYGARLGSLMMELFWIQVLNYEERPLIGIDALEEKLMELQAFVSELLEDSK